MLSIELAAARAELHRLTAIYTTDPVVEDLMQALDWPAIGGRLVESSCGDGAFLASALRRLLASGVRAEDVPLWLEAWEVSPSAAQEAREAIARELHPHPSAAAIARAVVRVGDFLTEGPRVPGYCAAVAGNPPYLRWADVPPVLKEQYRGVVPEYALADLMHAFLARCAEILAPGGRIGMVTPDRWLTNENAARLRATIGERLRVQDVKRLDSATAFRRPKKRRKGTPPRIHPVAVVLANDALEASGRRLTSQPLVEASVPHPGGPLLGEVARVRIAPWLGPDGIFTVDEATAARLEGADLVPVVDTPQLKGTAASAPTSWAIRTRPDIEPPAAVLAHLEAHRARMPKRRRAAWWMPPEAFHKFPLDEPMLVVPRIAPRLRTVRVPAGHLPVNHAVTVLAAGAWTLDRIERALASQPVQAWAATAAASDALESGYRSFTTRRLRALPIGEDA